MKLTQKQIKQIIKEELQSVLGEQEQQLDEGMGMVAMLMMKLFPPGVDALEANNVELDRNQVQAVLQIVGEQSPNALKTLESDLEIFGLEDADQDGKPELNLRVLNPNTTNDIVSGVVKSKKAQKSKAHSGSADAGSRVNFDLQAVNLQNMMDTNPEQAKTDAAKLMKMDGFKLSSKATQAKIKQIAGIANLAR